MIWKSVWSSHYLPKVNFFSWLLLHNKVLTGDNLLKRGFNGPFWCCFCKLALETTYHLLIGYDFSKMVWGLVLHGSSFHVPTHSSVNEFYLSWSELRPHILVKDADWHMYWFSILKITFWKLWIARNNCNFNNLNLNP